MKKTRFFLLLTVMLFAMNRVSAYDFEVDGMYYNIVSASDKTCSVTHGDEKYIGDVIIPEAVTYKGRTLSVVAIGEYAFENCSELKSITIPNSATEIGYSAFEGCKAITSITIPNSVTKIGSSAFYGCTALTTVKLPNSLTAINSYLFENCSSLESIMIPNSVTEIESSAFKGCSALESITIPCSVELIESAFDGCTVLENVIFEDSEIALRKPGWASDVTLFADSPIKFVYLGREFESGLELGGKKTLEKAVIGDKVTKIRGFLFSGCSSLTGIVIPNSVVEIGNSAFSGCSSLTNFVIPNSVVEIGSSVFSGCSGIETLIIEDGETPLELGCGYSHSVWGGKAYYGLFYGIPLKTLYLGRQIKNSYYIEDSPWSGGYETLKDVTIGENGIISNYWSRYTALENMWLLHSIPQKITSGTFNNKHYLNLNVYVPQGSLSAYQNADVWMDFWNLQEGAPTGVESVKSITQNAKNCYYDLRGNRLSAPKRGLNIINGKKVIVK